MEITYTERALKERDFWKKSGDKKIQKRITLLLNAIIADPQSGIGKPEILRGNLNGLWSRPIDQEHRLVYFVNLEEEKITIISMRFHY
ncbi:Txe/YoeB family addiction module toxin [Aequorivita lipolytica]|uniref:Putative mRNA interferase YoeB n=1 Tax=Aequorivita lipolytica TaxID=153267 RepID=A0A5C6YPA1_9FLAO|nr:Txe/YoeB family addiction module toxin [Aequorivita lipolytica]TXD68883.1 Txe/YoeB family addiction module toxin [Aequorivita lipolytica]SRX52144.1 Toxin RelK [Aequorivita lipolytica]